jgi:hypothetical protein
MPPGVSAYDELELRLVPRDGQYNVFISATSGATAHGSFIPPFTEPELRQFRRTVDPATRRTRGARSPHRAVTQKFGERLFDALFADPSVRDVYIVTGKHK